ncbi:DNA polymerase I [Marininema halotolerans]|uniref:DNA polymerase I n=1 Tax=Marininema halotolerans TaxID=1155944 RepID=A0A1I6S4I1_9BACL|nr:DNA polymerase I [Marininema halotolerans]SFS71810.1 DNA polymerase I [Marininema halotolerans]
MDKLVLIDGNSIAFRAFYALPLLTNQQGTYTNAAYGFTMMLMKVLEEEKPTHVLVAFDAGRVTFRHSDYEEYKGKRDKTPSELSEQFPLIKKILDTMGIRHHELDGYEADDIIGTMACQGDQQKMKTTIVTGDKDLLQLVTEYVTVLMTKKGVSDAQRYDIAEIDQRYGLTPKQIIDLKGLMGDSSDNIPGVPGVGEKTALKLLHEYGSVEEVLAHIDKLPGKKLKERVAEHQEQAKMSKQLATILCETPLDFDLSDLEYHSFDSAKVAPLFKQLEFKTLLQRISSADEELPVSTQAKDLTIHHITEENFAKWDSLFDEDQLSLFVEMNHPNYHRAEVLALALSSEENHLYIPISVAQKWEAFKNWLADPKKEKCAYDGKGAHVALRRYGLLATGISFDVMLASYLINPSESGHELSDIVTRKLDASLPADEDVYGKGAKRRQLEGEELAVHLTRKTEAMVKLQSILEEELENTGLSSLFFQVELPVSHVLAEMEWQGVKVDKEGLQELGKELSSRLKELTSNIFDLAGTEFNINSPKQLGEILFDRLGLPVLKKTKTGYSTSADVLEKLAPQHEIVEEILHYRQVSKLISTYVEGLMKERSEDDGKIHTRFQQAIAATGRLSSTDPNLQNIPIRMEEGRRIRKVFIPSQENWLLLAADYSQIELRVLAHLSGDENLIEAFHSNMDIHTKTAMDVFDVEADDVTPEMRRHAKAVNFGIVYGISDYGLSQNLNITRKEAGEFIERYLESYPGVRKYMDDIVKKAKQDGYVTTMLDRRRYLPDINSPNFNRRSFAERTAMNTPIQGSAADIIKKAMVEMKSALDEAHLSAVMLLQVHDELIFEAPEEELEKLTEVVRRVMEDAVELTVPLRVDVDAGKTWYDAK